MFRKTSIAILILAGGALGAVLLCVLALRVLLSAISRCRESDGACTARRFSTGEKPNIAGSQSVE